MINIILGGGAVCQKNMLIKIDVKRILMMLNKLLVVLYISQIKKMSGSFSNDLFQQLDLEKYEEKRIAKVRELASLSLSDLYKVAPKYRIVPKSFYDYQNQLINGVRFDCSKDVFRLLVRYTIKHIENLRTVPESDELVKLSKMNVNEIVQKCNELPLPMV